MVSTELALVQRRARVAYERGRLRLALLGVLPVALVMLVAVVFGHRPTSALGFGCATAALGAAMLWYGRDPQRAVLPGIAAGLVPMLLALCANRWHACGVDGCVSYCVPACTVGGIVAGLAVAAVGNRRRAGGWFWVSASALAVLTGSMGCSCVGYSGLAGLGLGFVGGMAPALLRRALGRGASA
jgi:hypothetical protein